VYHTIKLQESPFKSNHLTDERERPQEAKPAGENSSLGFIEAVHQ